MRRITPPAGGRRMYANAASAFILFSWISTSVACDGASWRWYTVSAGWFQTGLRIPVRYHRCSLQTPAKLHLLRSSSPVVSPANMTGHHPMDSALRTVVTTGSWTRAAASGQRRAALPGRLIGTAPSRSCLLSSRKSSKSE